MKLLYCKSKVKKKSSENELKPYKISYFSPSLFRVYKKSEKKSFKVTIVRLWFQLMSFGKGRIYYVEDEQGQVVHTSYVMPKCFKFPYLLENEYTIGPCSTISKCRGQGIYPKVLRYIVSNYGDDNTKYYMVVDSMNSPSIRGIEKAGFERIGGMQTRGAFKRYYIKNEE